MTEWEKFRDKLLAENPETRAEYERLGPLYDLINEAINRRHERGLTQEGIAERMGTRQPAIARFESGRIEPSFRFLTALADALDARLTIRLEPRAKNQTGQGKGPNIPESESKQTMLASEDVLARD